MQTLDQRDQAILTNRQANFERLVAGPRVGDYVRFPNGQMRRFTHDWGSRIQTTSHDGGDEDNPDVGSFYLQPSGRLEYSGGLDSGIPKGDLTPTGETRLGPCWFFHHDLHQAHNGVQVKIPCRLYLYTPAQNNVFEN